MKSPSTLFDGEPSCFHSLQKTVQKSLQKQLAEPTVKIKNFRMTRSGKWAFRMVVPLDVRPTLPRELPEEMGSPNIYVILGSDKKVAQLEALALTYTWKLAIENERNRLKGEAPLHLSHGTNPLIEQTYRNLSELSEEEVEDLILHDFIKREKNAERQRRRISTMSTDEKEEWLDAVMDDLAGWGNMAEHDSNLVIELAIPFFKKRGIMVDDPACSKTLSYTGLIIDSQLEHYTRTYDLLKTGKQRKHNSFFPSPRQIAGRRNLAPVSQPGSSHTVEDLCNAFVERKRQEGKGARTLPNIKYAMKTMMDFFGAKTPLRSIDTRQGEEYVRFLMTVPVNAGKRYPGISLVKAAEKEAKLNAPRTLSKRSIQKYFTWTRQCFETAIGVLHLNYHFNNPVRSEYRRLLPEKRETKNPMFTNEQLQKIFTSSRYEEEYHSEERGRYWIPLLCLFQGLRLDEATQLMAGNLIENEGILCLRITKFSTDGRNIIKRVKTKNSLRDVPVHPEIVRLGFVEFVRSVQESYDDPDTQLFPEYPIDLDSKGSIGNKVSVWFRRLREQLFGKMAEDGERAPGMHALRHAWRTALRRARVDAYDVEKLGGWSNKGASQEAEYGEVVWEHLKEAVEQVKYTDLDLSHFYPENQ